MIFCPLHMRGLGSEWESTFLRVPRGLAGVQAPFLLLTLGRYVTLSDGYMRADAWHSGVQGVIMLAMLNAQGDHFPDC